MQQVASRVCEASAKWPSVEPWCEFLRMTARVRLTTDHQGELMVSVRLRPRQYWRTLSPNELVLLCREALELLGMIAVVDPVSWQQLLQDRCGCEKHKFWNDWRMPPRFWVKLGDTKGVGEELDTEYYRIFFCDFDETSPERAKFRAAAAKIQSAMNLEMRYKLWRHEAFPVYVRCIPRRGIKAEQTNAYLESVVTMVKAAAQARDRATWTAPSSGGNSADKVRSSRLVLGDVEVHTTRLTLVPGSSQILAEFLKIPIDSTGFYPGVDIGADTTIGRLPATEFEPLLTALVSRSSSPSLSVAPTKGERACPSPNRVVISNSSQMHTLEANYAFTLRWKAVCSALGTAPRADEFEMDNLASGIGFGTRGKRYQWLAYAFFSKESTTSVTKLGLRDLDFFQGDINAILSILNAKNPASKLGGFARRALDLEVLAQHHAVADQLNALNALERAENGDEEGDEFRTDDDESDEDDDSDADSEAEVSDAAENAENDVVDAENGDQMDDVGDAEGDDAAAEDQVEIEDAGNGEHAGSEARAEDGNEAEDEDGIEAEDQDGIEGEDQDGIGDAENDEEDGDFDDEDGMFDGEDEFDDGEFEDERGIEDEDPDVRAYYRESFEDTRELPQDFGSVVLEKGTTILIDRFVPEGEVREHESLVLSEDGVFRVIENDVSTELVNIVVPSYGTCSVKREFVDRFVPVPESKTPSSIALGYSGSITSLRLSYLTYVNADKFLPVLKYLGTKLTTLELKKGVFMSPASLLKVLEACPHLTSLRVDAANDWPNEELVTAYSEKRCKLTKLRVGSIRPIQSTIDFIRTLQDPTTEIAETLQKLSLFHAREVLLGDDFLTAVVEMLEANSVLEYFEIAIYPEEATRFKTRLLETHGRVLPGGKGPPPLGCCLAFLSVLKAYSSSAHVKSEAPSESKRARLRPFLAMERIDRGVLSLIFQFAGEPRTRRIRIQKTEDNPHRFISNAEQGDSDDDSVAAEPFAHSLIPFPSQSHRSRSKRKSTSDAMQRWGEIVKPWRVSFQQMPDVLSSESAVHVDLGVDSTQRSWREDVLRCREALELECGAKCNSTRARATWLSSAAAHSAVHCYNRLRIRVIDDVEVFEASFFAFDGSTLRDEFRRALDVIHSQLAPDMKHKVEKHWRLPVRFFFSVTRHGPDISVAYLKSVMEVVKGIGGRASEATAAATAAPEADGSWQYRFPYTDTIARLNIDLCKLEQGAASLLTELLALGVQFDGEISFSSSSALGRLPISELGPVLHAITDAPPIRAPEGYEKILRGDWDELSLQDWRPDGEWHARLLQAVCSSLAVCKAFNKLRLSRLGGGASRKSSRKPIDDETQLRVGLESAVLQQDSAFRVMRNDKTLAWVDIAAPHYGHCIVPRASVDHFAPVASSDAVPVGYHGLITSLTIRDSSHEASHFLAS